MLLCINKYLKRPSKEPQIEHTMVDTLSPCAKQASEACANACFASPFVDLPNNRLRDTTTTTRANRSNFSKTSTSSLFPNTHFTNHESLPSLPNAYSSFIAAYPKYTDTQLADGIRDQEYHHLSDHVCLDYAGFSLFSHDQLQSPSSFDVSASHNSLPTPFESAVRKRIMGFLNIANEEYTMICTANRTSAFKLLAESYPFRSNKRLLTVYDNECESVDAMADVARKRGAKITSATFSWPSMRIHGSKLRKMTLSTRRKKKRGLFVFPLQSRMTGARYPYRWMSLAQENGWHVMLDACGLGPKDMDSLGLSLIQPDFIIFSFFKVFGEDPLGFAGLFIKKASNPSLSQSSAMATSIGVVSIVPARTASQLLEESSSTTDLEAQLSKLQSEGDTDDLQTENSQPNIKEQDGSRQLVEERPSEIVELESGEKSNAGIVRGTDSIEIECRGLDHADSMGLQLISTRLRYITNWLVIALMKLRHPHAENGHSLVRIYGPRVKFDRAPALSFNLFDWKGEKVEPALVQKLADRSNISLSCGFLHNIWFAAKYEDRKDAVLEKRVCQTTVGGKRKEDVDLGINVVSVSLGFLTNFEDAYRLWAFVAMFLDADFVEKERWRCMALNQKMIEV